MLPKASPSFLANPDAELEWFLCLASALQARHKQSEKLTVERQPLPEPSVLRKLQGLFRRGTQRTTAA
jgi:hypothetical protein